VDDLEIAFEHAYFSSSKVGSLSGVSSHRECNEGNSPDDGCTNHPMSTEILYANGTARTFKVGEAITLQLREYLALANLTLDMLNTEAGVDFRDRGAADPRFPRFRTSGLLLNVDLEYSNLRNSRAKVQFNRDVNAKMKVVRVEVGWAGMGPQTYLLEVPILNSAGVKTASTLIRYRQGVVIEFVPKGFLYKLDYYHLLTTLIATFVLLNIAGVIVDAVTFYMLPNGISTVLQNKRAERISKKTAFAQLGLKAAIAVEWFRTLDTNSTGSIGVEELVKVFGHISSVSKDNALMMARTIMRSADRRTGEGEGRLCFNEFMSCIEGGDTLDFDRYVDLVHTTAGRPEKLAPEVERAASRAYDNVAKIDPGSITRINSIV